MERHLGPDWILPILTPHSTPYFTAGSIQIQHCDDCGRAQHPPEDVCRSCQGTRLSFRAMPGTGRVESAAVVHHAVHPGLADRVPYVIAIVSVDGAPGCNVQGNVVGCAPDAVAIGQKVRAVFEDATDPATGRALRIPQWEIAGDEG